MIPASTHIEADAVPAPSVEDDDLIDDIHPPPESELEEDGTDPDDEEDATENTVESEEEQEETEEQEEATVQQTLPLQQRETVAPSTTSLATSHAFHPLPPRKMAHRHHDAIMRTAHQAINSAVMEPSTLSGHARNMLLERQQSDSRLLAERSSRPSTPTRVSSSSSLSTATTAAPSPSPSPSPSSKHGGRSKQRGSTAQSLADPLHPPPPESLSVFRLTALNQLLQQHARRGNFIMLDLDETLMMTKHQPALLLSSYGVRMFQSYVRSTFSDFATKNRLCRQLEKALKDKVLVESDTAIVVAQLQKAGCWVFGVTARYPELATNTQRTLLSLGISLGSSAPFPSTVIKDPVTEAVFSDGVIYCGRESKAKVVSRFLENVVFAQLLQRAQREAREQEERLAREEQEQAERLLREQQQQQEDMANGTGAGGIDSQAPTPSISQTPSRTQSNSNVAAAGSITFPAGMPELQASPSMVSICSDTPPDGQSGASSPSQSSVNSPRDSEAATPLPLNSGDFMSPFTNIGTVRPRMGSAVDSAVTPLPIDRALRPRQSPDGAQGNGTQSNDGIGIDPGLEPMQLLRSVSSPAAMRQTDRFSEQQSNNTNAPAVADDFPGFNNGTGVSLLPSFTPSNASLLSRESSTLALPPSLHMPSPSSGSSTLFRSASVARAMATPLLSASRGARHRSRRARLAEQLGDSGTGALLKTPLGKSTTHASTPSSVSAAALRRTFSVQGLSSGPGSTQATPISGTISKRSRLQPGAQRDRAIGGLPSSTKRSIGASNAAALRAAKRRIKVKARVPRSALPPEVIFVDNEVRHVAEMQTGLRIAQKLKIPLRCYCFAPQTHEEMEQMNTNTNTNTQQQPQSQMEDQPTAQEASALQTAVEHHRQDLSHSLSQLSVDASAINASNSNAQQPLQSPHTQLMSSGLSLANLTSPARVTAGQSDGIATSGFPSSLTTQPQPASTGVYGFMLALGNVLPASTVSVSAANATPLSASNATGGSASKFSSPYTASRSVPSSTVTSPNPPTAAATATVNTTIASPPSAPVAKVAQSEEIVSPSKAEASVSQILDAPTPSRPVLPTQQPPHRHAQLYDEDEIGSSPSPPIGVAVAASSQAAVASAMKSPSLRPANAPSPSMRSVAWAPRPNAVVEDSGTDTDSGTPSASSASRRVPRNGTTLSSAAEDTNESETETEPERDTDGGTTEYTDATTEYTDETQTSCTDETDGAESDATAVRSVAPSSSVSSHIPNVQPVRPMLMPATRVVPTEPVTIPGLSTTEQIEVAAAALGDESAAVLQVQMATFAQSGIILTNQEALEKLREQQEEEDEDEDEEDEDDEEEDDDDQ